MRTILVSAYGCEPLKGSEPGVGWNWVLQMAKRNKLHVVTRANNQKPIEQHLPAEVADNIIFHYYDTPVFIRRLKNKAKGLYFYYFCWQIGIIPLVRRILNAGERIDYTMHLTFGSLWMPTFLPFFKTPFIWGPVGGGDCEPKSFLKVLPLKQRVIQTGRYVLNALSVLNPLVMIPAARAVRILARTPNSAHVIPSFFQKKTRVVLETAMESEIFGWEKRDDAGDVFKMITTGRLLPNKNILTVIRALKYIPQSYKLSLTIVGSGYQRAEMEKEIQGLGREQDVQIKAEMPRKDVLDLVEKSDLFLFPSLREGGSWSLMEAMAIGLPVICLDWAGMSVTTDDACAIRLPVTTPEQMPKDMAVAIMKLMDNPELRKQMGEHGRKRIREIFNWDAKGQFMEELFEELEEKKSFRR